MTTENDGSGATDAPGSTKTTMRRKQITKRQSRHAQETLRPNHHRSVHRTAAAATGIRIGIGKRRMVDPDTPIAPIATATGTGAKTGKIRAANTPAPGRLLLRKSERSRSMAPVAATKRTNITDMKNPATTMRSTKIILLLLPHENATPRTTIRTTTTARPRPAMTTTATVVDASAPSTSMMKQIRGPTTKDPAREPPPAVGWVSASNPPANSSPSSPLVLSKTLMRLSGRSGTGRGR